MTVSFHLAYVCFLNFLPLTLDFQYKEIGKSLCLGTSKANVESSSAPSNPGGTSLQCRLGRQAVKGRASGFDVLSDAVSATGVVSQPVLQHPGKGLTNLHVANLL